MLPPEQQEPVFFSTGEDVDPTPSEEIATPDLAERLDEEMKAAAAKPLADDKDLIKIPYDSYFPYASKTFINHTISAKVGDDVKADQALGDSNYTKDGVLALGKNMLVGYQALKGWNSNDAVVISSGAAKKLTSAHMYKEPLEIIGDMKTDKETHRQYFGVKYTAAQYNKLDSAGVAKKGQVLLPHDPIIVGVAKSQPSATDLMLGNFKRSRLFPYKEVVVTWDHDFQGTVMDVYTSTKRVVVTVYTEESMRVGDKLSNRYGGKGVISRIIPDHQMIHDENNNPIDVLFTSAGIISRINPAQVIETAVAKVAKKTGKPIVIESFSGKNNVQWAQDLLKQHGISDKETVTDPMTGKKIPGVLVGPQYLVRLFKTTDSNFAARGTGSYDLNQQPSKGGLEGAKGIGSMEFNALIAHGAKNVLKEVATLKSQKNDEFWRALQLGLPLPAMKVPFAYDKFVALLQASGIKADKNGNKITLLPLTDRDITKMSSGVILNDKLVRAKDMAPEKGGLFDIPVTGGLQGNRWSHIELAEPIVSPIFAEPVRRLLGWTSKELEENIKTKGGNHIKKLLNNINIDDKIKDLRAQLKSAKPATVDGFVKQIKYLEALNKTNLKPGDAYVQTKLVVLPPVMRPILPGMGSSSTVVGDSNYLYQDVLKHNLSLRRQVDDPILPPQEHAQLRNNLYTAVGALMGTHDSDNAKLAKRGTKGFIDYLAGTTTPKGSFFQMRLMKRQQDLSGRGTAAPDPTIDMDHVGLPEDMLWGMFGKLVIGRLVGRGFSPLQAKDMVEKKHPAARDALLAEARERPVMFNRAPTLHRYSFYGAYATPVPGKTIRVSPFVEKGLNLDYDGDTLQVHTPISPKAVAEVKNMLPSNLIFGDESRNDLMLTPGHEAVLGLNIASGAATVGGKEHAFKTQADAMAAYHAGKINLKDNVKIG